MASPTPGPLVAAVLVAVLCGACGDRLVSEDPVEAVACFDFEPFLFAPADHSVKDHSLIVRDGTVHLFYTTGTDSLGRWQPPGNEIAFGHATSPDWRHWTVRAPVIDWPPEPWEERNRWAPHVIEDGDGYRMYYTGVNGRVAQSIGQATSRDLEHWRPSGAAVFRPDTAWAAWRADGWSNCRDPFVLRHAGSWWMVVTATARDGREALGLARSTDGRTWEDRGPLVLGERGDPLESAQLVELDHRWFLLFTSGRRGGTWIIDGNALTGPWEFAARRRWLEGIAPEITVTADGTWVSRHATYDGEGRRQFVLLLDRLRLAAGGPILEQPPLPGWMERTGEAFESQPVLGDSPRYRGAAGVGHGGVGWIGTAEGFARPPDPPGALRGDALTGRMRSHPFTLRGAAISLRIGGSRRPGRVGVALRRSGDDSLLFQETGNDRELLEERIWWTAPLAGEQLYVELLDADPAGHLNVDDIRETETLPHGLRSVLVDVDPLSGAATIRVIAALMALPPPGALRIDVVDRAGAAVCELTVAMATAGEGLREITARWNGTDAAGAPVEAGDYEARLPLVPAAELVVRLPERPPR